MTLWFANAVAYWLQVAVISMAAALVARTARVRSPQCSLACWQALLAAFVFLPWLEPWSAGPAAVTGFSFAAAATRVPSLGPAHIAVVPLVWGTVIAGIAVRLVWLGMGYLRLRRWRREATPLSAHHASIEPVRAAVNTTAEVYLSPEVRAPVTFGLRHAAVLLPLRWLDLEPASRARSSAMNSCTSAGGIGASMWRKKSSGRSFGFIPPSGGSRRKSGWRASR